jgi:hypothetical protein
MPRERTRAFSARYTVERPTFSKSATYCGCFASFDQFPDVIICLGVRLGFRLFRILIVGRILVGLSG